VGKTLRVLRVMRSLRILRLAKLRRIIEDIQDRITSEYFHIIVNVVKLILIIVWTNHFIACAWWAIGIAGPREGDADADGSWTSNFRVQEADLGYKYFTALHWSLTQFTPASMEIFPRNLAERIFSVLVLLFAMIVFSSFVSSITSAMTQLRQLNSGIDKGFVMLRRYLRVRRTTPDLTVRIVRCVEHRLSARKGEVPESDVALLQHLSKPLQMELLSHILAPVMTKHPFFRRYAEVDPVAMQRLCLGAVQRVSLSTGDTLFTESCIGDQMFFVRSGKLRYHPSSYFPSGVQGGPARMRTSSSLRRSRACRPVQECICEEGEWFCESSLWCTWAHWGTMVALRMSEVLAVDAKAFACVTALHHFLAASSLRYGSAFVERLNEVGQDGPLRDICQFWPEDIDQMAEQAFSRRANTNSTSVAAFKAPMMTTSGLEYPSAIELEVASEPRTTDSPEAGEAGGRRVEL